MSATIKREKYLCQKLIEYLESANRLISVYEYYSVVISISILTIIVITNLIARNLFKSLYFVEEVSMIMAIFCTFSGLSYAARKNLHIRMSAIIEILPHLYQKIFVTLIVAMSSLAMFFMCFFAVKYVHKVYMMEQYMPALNILYWWAVAIVPVGFFLTGLQYFLLLIKNLSGQQVWLSLEGKL